MGYQAQKGKDGRCAWQEVHEGIKVKTVKLKCGINRFRKGEIDVEGQS
jgi:hypothetical protein